ncbi:cytochrome b6-f complex subunit PetL [Chamaesiphon minutus]|uniref:Cytochrome b6-f complex subunit 6 n=1 Tax=Chamaesiphon minutus (strain ATCC 27169 / PCC 6605) TaxID=1173020 RepID=K9UL58_CHAP6|nr:cytochrome b6-f complex subunit PetL [Chamaesiphon minutus]AFY95186.1 Cytochrome B6-F complex subunit VI (PetL) [Chamaesiphon minutus PCC 6605]
MSGAIAYLGFVGIMFGIAMGLFFGLRFAKII